MFDNCATLEDSADMRVFILVMFWILLGEAFLKLICTVVIPYPRERTVRSDQADAIMGIAMAFWAAYLLWT
jgi:hypothetical protein